MADPARLMAAARTNLLLHHPFFGALALYMCLVPDVAVRTAATDGRDIFYDPAFVTSLAVPSGVDRLQALIAHEVLHVALGHLFRRAGREAGRWNAACDFAANLLLAEDGFVLPPDTLFDRSFAGLSAEAIYQRLSDSPAHCQGFNPLDDHSRWDRVDAASAARLSAEWRCRVAQAAQLARQRGQLPASLRRLVEDILYPRLDWRQALALYLRPAGGDYTFLPPDRRFLADGLYLPDFSTDALEDIVVAIDTSGSVWDYYQEFMRELTGIVLSYPQFRGYVAMVDAGVQLFEELVPDYLPREIRGGGGTDFRPFFKEITRRGLDPTLVIFLTDGDAVFPSSPPPYPVLWVLLHRSCSCPPWGAVAYLDP